MHKKNNTLYASILLAPAVIFLAAFTHIPAIKTLMRSFTQEGRATDGSAPPVSWSLDSYRFMLEDDVLLQVLQNSAVYALITVPVSIVMALMMALWVNQKMRGTSFLRLAYFTPTVLPMIAVANLWLFFYAPEIGLINSVLNKFGFSGQNWLGDPDLSLYSLMAITIWKEAGFFMIFYLAALQMLSQDLYQAARVEGASAWQQFKCITWPLLMPTTLFIFVNAVLNAFKLVDHVFILTKGGPNNATNLLLYYIYETAFSFFDTPYAAVLTVILLLILVVIALLQFGLLERRVHYR